MVGQQLKAKLRTPAYDLLEHFPALYCERVRAHGDQIVVVSSSSGVVIEGYQGSANSFARAAFLHANPTVEVASHLHTVAHVIRALELGVPVMVLLREPASAMVSWLQRFPHISVRRAVTRYVTFHRQLWSYRDRVVLVGFDVVTSDFGRAIAAVNERFGTSFVPFLESETSRDEVFDRLDDAATRVFGSAERSARPSADRATKKDALAEEIRAYRRGRGLRAATEAYERLMAAVPDSLR